MLPRELLIAYRCYGDVQNDHERYYAAMVSLAVSSDRGIIIRVVRKCYRNAMSFLELFFIFSLATIGLYHVVVGVTGILTGSSLVYPMPYMLNRPGLYLLIAGVLCLNWIQAHIDPTVASIAFLVLLADLLYEMVRPLLSASEEVVGVGPKDMEGELLQAFSKLGLRYTGTFPDYRTLEPYARIHVRYNKHQDAAEVRIAPRSRKSLLEEIARTVAKDRDAVEVRTLQRGYLTALVTGVILMLVALVSLGIMIR